MDEHQQSVIHSDFLINMTDFSQRKFSHVENRSSLENGQVRLALDTFALTANNITYAVAGDDLQYWAFFPSEENGMGRVPVWGFADVSESRCDDLEVGERVYGYLPISTDFIATPVSVSRGGFTDGAPHRLHLHPVYNQYTRVSGDPSYVPSLEAQQMILRPLFVTSFLIEDFLRDNEYFGADRIILSSASSKTAIGTAYQVVQSASRPAELVGLTSERNRDFVSSLGLYDSVVTYDTIDSIAATVSSVLVDMAGNEQVLQKVHAHLDSSLKYSCRVGKSHWDAGVVKARFAGPKPEWFFAPAQFKKRADELGAAQLMQLFSTAAIGFVSSTSEWMEIVATKGEAAIDSAFEALLAGGVSPSQALVMSF